MVSAQIDDPEFWRRGPDGELAELRRTCPVAEFPDSGFWAVTGHREIVEMSRDPATYCSAKGVLIGDVKREVSGNDSILYIDPPRHVAMRRIVNKGFTVRRIAQQADVIEKI